MTTPPRTAFTLPPSRKRRRRPVKYLSANPGRSGHRLSVAGAEIVYNARKEVARFFGVQYPERVIFTKNCTEALNTAIFGGIREGGHVITTRGEHNSVLRPLFFLAKEGKIRLDIVSAGDNAAEEIAKLLRPDTCMVVMNHVSNVTGSPFSRSPKRARC